jgi:hypothetical protein
VLGHEITRLALLDHHLILALTGDHGTVRKGGSISKATDAKTITPTSTN